MAARKSTKKNQTESAHLPVPVASDGAPERAAAPEPARLVIVDAANAGDAAPDGSAAHPFARIQDAADAAGENAVIYARSGIYREAVALKPGQHLTSALELGGGLAGRAWAEPTPPVIAPETPRRAEGCGRDVPAAALVLPENASARRIEIRLDWADDRSALDAAARARLVEKLLEAGLKEKGLPGAMLTGELREEMTVALRKKVEDLPPETVAKLAFEEWDLSGGRAGAAAVLGLAGRGGEDREIGIRDCVVRASGDAAGIALVVPKFRALGRFAALGNDVSAENGDGVAAFLARGARAALDLADNSVATTGDRARAVRLSLVEGGAKLEARVLRNRLATWGDDADGLRVAASGAGCELAGVIGGNRIRTAGGRACGALVHPREGASVGALTLADNDIATEGEGAKGINLWANDEAEQGALVLTGNILVTSGDKAPALMAQCDEGSRTRSLMAGGNDLTALGSVSRALHVSVNRDAVLAALDCRDNRIVSLDDDCGAFSLDVEGEVKKTALIGNRIAARGKRADAALALLKTGGAMGELRFAENDVETRGDAGVGVNLRLYEGARTGKLALTENRIVCAGAAGHGIEFSVAEDATPSEPPHIRDNEIETKGAKAHGLSLSGRGLTLAGLVEAREGNVFRILGAGGQEMFFASDDAEAAPAPEREETNGTEDFELPDEI